MANGSVGNVPANRAVVSPSLADVAWAAGFLEGEGTFFRRKNGLRVSAPQVEWDPIEKLMRIFGGQVYARSRKNRRKCQVQWEVNGPRAMGVMLTMYPFLSSARRGQVLSAIEGWKPDRRRGFAERGLCKLGHPFLTNAELMPSGYYRCKSCRAIQQRERRERQAGFGEGRVPTDSRKVS